MTAPLLGLTMLLAAPALKDRPTNVELVGEWSVESAISSGNRATTGGELVYTFTRDGKWLIHRQGKELPSQGRGFSVDPGARPPRVELISNTTRADATRRLGICKFEKDTVTLCVAASGQPRPTEFESTKENRCTVYVLKRKKPD
jgi:uncharacterized protein (TIGR03067 family)